MAKNIRLASLVLFMLTILASLSIATPPSSPVNNVAIANAASDWQTVPEGTFGPNPAVLTIVREVDYRAWPKVVAFYHVEWIGTSNPMTFGVNAKGDKQNRDGWYSTTATNAEAIYDSWFFATKDADGNLGGNPVEIWWQLECYEQMPYAQSVGLTVKDWSKPGDKVSPNYFILVPTSSEQQAKGVDVKKLADFSCKTPKATMTPTAQSSATATSTPTATTTAVPSETPTMAPTSTPTSVPSQTPTSTTTSVPSVTSSPTATPSPTSTPQGLTTLFVPLAYGQRVTSTPTPTPSPSATPQPSACDYVAYRDVKNMYLINGRVGAGNPEMEVSWSPMQNAWLQIVDLTINSDWPTVVMQLNTSQGFGTYHYWVKGTEISVNWLGAPGWAKFVVRTDDVPPSAGPFNNGRNGDDFLISIQLDGNNLYCSRNFHIDP